jgi:hypothetical protein
MATTFIDLTGQTFGRLLVLERSFHKASKRARWLCKCNCGNTLIVRSGELRSGGTKSCGCLREELVYNRGGISLVGHTFGRLEVIQLAFSKPNHNTSWLCKCDCGNSVVVVGHALRTGHTKSCGCLKREVTAKRSRKQICDSRHPLYKLWTNMHQRCSNPNIPAYARYGGRGIKVCERWKSFTLFVADMPARPSPEHSIHRKDNDGNYEAKNCCWATPNEQVVSQPQTRFANVDGITDSVKGTARRVGIDASYLRRWIKRGCDPQQIVDRWRKAGRQNKGYLNDT